MHENTKLGGPLVLRFVIFVIAEAGRGSDKIGRMLGRIGLVVLMGTIWSNEWLARDSGKSTVKRVLAVIVSLTAKLASTCESNEGS